MAKRSIQMRCCLWKRAYETIAYGADGTWCCSPLNTDVQRAHLALWLQIVRQQEFSALMAMNCYEDYPPTLRDEIWQLPEVDRIYTALCQPFSERQFQYVSPLFKCHCLGEELLKATLNQDDIRALWSRPKCHQLLMRIHLSPLGQFINGDATVSQSLTNYINEQRDWLTYTLLSYEESPLTNHKQEHDFYPRFQPFEPDDEGPMIITKQ